jgi:hypothetical protein
MKRKWALLLTIGAITLEAGLALIYLAIAAGQPEHMPAWLDFNGLRSLPSRLQAALLFSMGGGCSVLMTWRRHLRRPLSIRLLGAIALLCFYGSLDELFKVHLYIDQINWRGLYIGVLLAIPLLGWRDILWLWQQHREIVICILTGLSVFLLGGFGAEMIRGEVTTDLPRYAAAPFVFVPEHLRIAIEEGGELIGETIILYGFARFFQEACSSPLPSRTVPHG